MPPVVNLNLLIFCICQSWPEGYPLFPTTGDTRREAEGYADFITAGRMKASSLLTGQEINKVVA